MTPLHSLQSHPDREKREMEVNYVSQHTDSKGGLSNALRQSDFDRRRNESPATNHSTGAEPRNGSKCLIILHLPCTICRSTSLLPAGLCRVWERGSPPPPSQSFFS